MNVPRRPRDIALLDAVDACAREGFEGVVWRVARDGRDPLQPSASQGRWSDGSFDVLYTSLERDGAIAEIFALLSAQPVFPSRMQWRIHQVSVRTKAAFRVADVSSLKIFGVEASEYPNRSYGKTQDVADAAHFLGFDALVVPSARWDCHNLVLFTDRVAPSDIVLEKTEPDAIDWSAWRRAMKR